MAGYDARSRWEPRTPEDYDDLERLEAEHAAHAEYLRRLSKIVVVHYASDEVAVVRVAG